MFIHKHFLVAGLLFSLAVTTLRAGTVTVDANGGADYTEIQTAIDEAESGDTVLVRSGEYLITESIRFSGPVSLTIRSENGPEETTIRMSPDPTSALRRSVVLFDEGASDVVFEGFTLTGGGGSIVFTSLGNLARMGGGILCAEASSPTIKRCVLTGNSFPGEGGGGLACHERSSPTVIECTFTGNTVTRVGGDVSFGGGVFANFDSSPVLDDCTIEGNSAFLGGGVMIRENGSPELTDCRIVGNTASGNGGGVSSFVVGFPTFTRCLIAGNVAEGNGGGVALITGQNSFDDCVIAANRAAELGGGMWVRWSSPTLVGCTLVANSASQEGGGLFCEGESSVTMFHCTLTDNTATTGGGLRSRTAVGGGGSRTPVVSIESSILWNNGVSNINTPSGEIAFSCVQGGWQGTGNIETDPQFCWEEESVAVVDQAEFEAVLGTYRTSLSPESPCRGAGESGSDMGADSGVCSAATSLRRVNLAAGLFHAQRLVVPGGTELRGVGEETALEGTVSLASSEILLADLTVRGGTNGGIVVAADQSPKIEGVVVMGNSAFFGGGIICQTGSSPEIRGCTVRGNTTRLDGAGIYAGRDSSPLVVDTMVLDNAAERNGGGIYASREASPTVLNSLVAGNRAGGATGGVHAAIDSSVHMTHCTVAENLGGGLTARDRGSIVFENGIVFGNPATPIATANDGTMEASHSLIEGDSPWPGPGNLVGDPLFVATGAWDDQGSPDDVLDDVWSAGDYRLRGLSAAIDEGDSEFALPTDIAGTERDCGEGVDLGAYEFCGPLPAEPRFLRGDCDGDTTACSGVNDALSLLGWLFLGDSTPSCLAACDADASTTLELADAIYGLNFCFQGAAAPAAPFPDCGAATQGDLALGCETSLCE